MDPNIQTAQQTAQQAIQQEKSSVNVFWIYLVAIFLAIALGISGYFIGLGQTSGKKPAVTVPKAPAQTQSALPAGLKKAQNNIKLYPGLLTSTKITQNYSGKLTFFVPEKSWTLENKGKTVTINNEADSKVNYYIKPDEPNAKSQPADKIFPKVGDKVIISTFFGPNGGKLQIDRITLLLPSQNPLSATPSSSAVQK